MEKLKHFGLTHSIVLSYLCLFFGIGFGIAGLWIPPVGSIHSSVLILIAQLFVLSAGFIGLDIKVDLNSKYFHAKQTANDTKKDIEAIQKAADEQFGQLSENQEVKNE